MSDSAMWRPFEISQGDISGPSGLPGLCEYLSDTAEIDRLLIEKKALVFRGFRISREDLPTVLDLVLRDRLAYIHGNSPRTKIDDNVYTSTEYPPEFVISMHNELSYAARWPARLLFYCETAPPSGGATPVADGTRWLNTLDAEVRNAFSAGLRYSQNLPNRRGFGRSWQDTFETDDPGAVEAYLSGAGATWEWTKRGLRVHQVRPATARHPVTGAEVWFNQADQWHPATLGDELAGALAAALPEDDLPQSVRFADGTPIPDRYVCHIRDRGLEVAVDVDWHQGDVLLIDNVLVAHGRRAFTGNRRVLVAMSN